MMSINTRFKAAVLAVSLLAVGNASAFSMPTISVKKVAVLGLIASWVRLQSKPSKDYKASDWKEDLRSMMEDYEIFDLDLYKKLVELFDKYFIGRKLSIVDVNYRTKNEDDTVVTLRDKKIKSTPFGVIGLFDAYVIGMLEKVGKIAKDWDSANSLYTKLNDVTIFGDDNTVAVKK